MMFFPRILFALFFHGVVESKECKDICGRFKEYKEEEPVKSQKESEDKRVVNGKDVADRKFMVLLRAVDPSDPENYETCGGALINDRYVLTAGHCVCIQSGLSNVQCDMFGKLQYDPTQVLKVHIGLDDADINQIGLQNYAHKVEKVIKHEKWDGSGLTSPDLALVKLARNIKFDTHIGKHNSRKTAIHRAQEAGSKLLPICFQQTPNAYENIYNSVVYVAGWGRLRNEDCFTDNQGPNRHDRCRFPFIYNNKKYDHCITDQESPSFGNRRCKQFRTSKNLKKINEPVMILYNRKRRSTVCYKEETTTHGWCGVCLKNASPWSYGYCPYGANPPPDDALITRVKRAKHWGFCSHLCTINNTANKLQEAQMTTLSIDDCARFNTTVLSYRQDSELCAGNKIPYPLMTVYVRKKLRKPRQGYIFLEKSKKKNTVIKKTNRF